MATAFSSFHSPIFSSAAPPSHRNRKASAQPNHWWAPLFGWSAEPDYMTNGAKIESGQVISGNNEIESGRIGAEKDLFRGCFTEEKAKELRKKTIETSSFHDSMYHSAVASRLASDVSRR